MISVVQADITTLEVDAIVNAANPSLLGGGGGPIWHGGDRGEPELLARGYERAFALPRDQSG